ncbi:hypothetical protein CCH79_00011752 [Gambusia affinis]|uniref:Uncharacterized protein n=1 Tax=Gambusia affinis TaxID=33528 RepID=A0A315VMX1_GAMAF|nr:hypothetical protein CCH79_00011752 [Gambusia affinis]
MSFKTDVWCRRRGVYEDLRTGVRPRNLHLDKAHERHSEALFRSISSSSTRTERRASAAPQAEATVCKTRSDHQNQSAQPSCVLFTHIGLIRRIRP